MYFLYETVNYASCMTTYTKMLSYYFFFKMKILWMVIIRPVFPQQSNTLLWVGRWHHNNP